MALSSPGTLSLERLDSPDPGPAGQLEEEPWQPPCEIREALSSFSLASCLEGPADLGDPCGREHGSGRGAHSCWGSKAETEGPFPSPLVLPVLAVSNGSCPSMDPEAECSMDIIVVGSSAQASTPSPSPAGDWIYYKVKANRRAIEELCICCGSFRVHRQHPLFEGGMCSPCKDKFRDYFFLYDDDGYQSYCSICCAGQTLLICENPDCTRCYCFECVDTLVGPKTSGKIQAMSNWVCFLCLPSPRNGLLQRRRKWRERLKAFYDQDSVRSRSPDRTDRWCQGPPLCWLPLATSCRMPACPGTSPLRCITVLPVWKREPVRVLSLFGDIRNELTSLGFLENGPGSGRLKYLADVTDVVRKSVEKWGPFDLVYGCTPPLRQAADHSPGWYLFQFHRILQYSRPRPRGSQPFFWMFVDNLLFTEDDHAIATRFLETEPVTILDACGRTVRNAVHVWSNIPAVRSPALGAVERVGDGLPSLRSRHSDQVPREELSLLAQDRQRARAAAAGPATLVKKCFLPLREYFKYFQSNSTSS
ncbi:hypothetical protein QTO34_014840 [Cnephaeus nilssonii]|uniref:PHD-type domain-containing protein n=1 Tax=Cnephaeus nilssonii TaxID=3371016 RepID=A0AA40I761_CNENI|nr:hypothetical protein QTO34_014840 [Eptesicus nilssonii]